MFLLLLLPALSYCLLFIIIYHFSSETNQLSKLRLAATKAALLISVFLVLATELLSVFKLVSAIPLIIAWLTFITALIIFIWKKRMHIPRTAHVISFIKRMAKTPSFWLIVPLLLVSGAIAVAYPPNNYDSLTYHMARVGHWINNKSVYHYPTHILRQLVYPPFAEWIILHAQVLSGTDRFANCIQTIFFAGCIIQVSLIVKELGGNRSRQVIAMIVTSLIPMAVIQSNTTQNDIVVAWYILTFILFSIRLKKNVNNSDLLFAGLSFGLALLTKGTAYLYLAVFSLWYVAMIVFLHPNPVRTLLKRTCYFMLIPVTAVLLNLGHYSRNLDCTGSAFGNAVQGVSNDGFNIKSIIVVAIKNTMNHLPVTGDMKDDLISFCNKFKIDVNDPAYSFSPLDGMMVGLSYHEDYAQNYAHTIAIFLVMLLFFLNPKFYARPLSHYGAFVLTCIAATVMYCVLFKWQPWANRLQTCLFMMFCIPVAYTIAKFPRILQLVILLPFLYYGISALLKSSRHPIIPTEQSIIHNPYSSYIYYDGLLDCKRFIDTTNARSFGIYIGADMPDYVYFKMLAESPNPDRRMVHLFIDNESKRYTDSLVPEIIITTGGERTEFRNEENVWKREIVFQKEPAIFRLQPRIQPE